MWGEIVSSLPRPEGAAARDVLHDAVLLNPAIAGITRLSATETVRARIAFAIELGLLSAGEQLPPDPEIAGALGVGDITVRRALKSLADEGLLVRVRGRRGGTFVADAVAGFSPASVVDAVSVYRSDSATVHDLINRRVLLECALVHHAALVIDGDQLAALDELVERGASAESWADYHAADERLHLAVARASGLDWAMPLYEGVLYELYRYFLPYPVSYLHGVNEQHRLLVAALRRRDAVDAVAVIEAHVGELHRAMFVGLPQPEVRPASE